MPVSKVDRLLQGCGVFDSLAVNLSELGLRFLLPERWNFDVVSLDEETAESDLEAAELDLTVTIDSLSLERMKTHLLELSKLLNQTSGFVSQAYSKINRDTELAKTLTAGVKDALKEVTQAGFGKELAELLEANRKLVSMSEERAEEIRALRITRKELEEKVVSLEGTVEKQEVELQAKTKQISDLETKQSLLKSQAKETETKLKTELSERKTQNDKLSIKMAALKQDLEDLQTAHKSLLDSLSASEKEMQEERLRMLHERTQLQEKLLDRETLLSKLDTKFNATEKSLADAQKDNIAYRGDIGKLNAKIVELEKDLATKHRDIFEATKTLDAAIKKLVRLEVAEEQLNEENTKLREEVSFCTSKLHAIQAEVKEKENLANTRIAESERAIADATKARADMTALSAQVDNLVKTASRDAREAVLVVAEAERQQLLGDFKESNQKVQELLSELDRTPEALLPPLPIKADDRQAFCHACRRYLVGSFVVNTL